MQGTSIELGLIGNNLSTNVHVPVTVSPMNVVHLKWQVERLRMRVHNWEQRMLSQSFDPVFFFVICFVISTQNLSFIFTQQ